MPFGESILIAPQIRQPGVTEPAPVRWLLVSAAAVLLGLFVAVPLGAFRHRLHGLADTEVEAAAPRRAQL